MTGVLTSLNWLLYNYSTLWSTQQDVSGKCTSSVVKTVSWQLNECNTHACVSSLHIVKQLSFYSFDNINSSDWMIGWTALNSLQRYITRQFWWFVASIDCSHNLIWAGKCTHPKVPVQAFISAQQPTHLQIKGFEWMESATYPWEHFLISWCSICWNDKVQP